MSLPSSLIPHYTSVPENAVCLAWQKGSNIPLYSAVANTQWGKVPGTATTELNCWFPYGNKEHQTKNFSWLVAEKDSVWLWKNDGSGPPRAALGVGHQTDGAGNQYAAIARSPDGMVPGKAKDNTCWYSNGGKEKTSSDFDWLVCADVGYALKKKPGPPQNGVQLGYESEGIGNSWCAVAHTKQGAIPGKAKERTCWFTRDGEEHTTQNFSWIVIKKGCSFLEIADGAGAPAGALKVGHQTDGGGEYYAAVADSAWGLIPGKAMDTTCWYPYGGKEHFTTNFLWVVSWKFELPARGEIRQPIDRQTVDVISQTQPQARMARVIDQENTWRRVVTLIGNWNANFAPLTRGTLATLSDIRMENEVECGSSASLVVYQDDVMLAKAIIQLGVDFGRRMIRHCLNLSLQNQTVTSLTRQSKN